MVRPRWRKLRGDLRASAGRLVIAQLAIGLALAAVGTVLGARTVLGREIAASYRSTHPADATFELAGEVDDGLLAELRTRPDVAAAERRQMVRARVKLRPDDPWQMFLLFVADDPSTQQLATVRPVGGAWPPPDGTVLLERSSVVMLGLAGESLIIQTPHGTPRSITVSGIVHDAGQAPSWQEHRGCGYATRATLATLGEPAALHDLLVRFQPEPHTTADADAAAARLAGWLRDRGQTMHEIRVPNLRQHPHQGLMNAVQLVLLCFSLLLFLLGSFVLATTVSAILARQTREIGVMKAVGASTGQIVTLYGGFVLAVGAAATAVAVPLAYLGATAMVGRIGAMMNLALADATIPRWVFVLQVALGLAVPLVVAAVPILRAARCTVRQAIAGHGTGAAFARPAWSRLPIALRNLLRRPARLALTMSLLVVGGALVLAAANVERGLSSISAKLDVARRYDVEIHLHQPVPAARVATLAGLAGVSRFEAWAITDAAFGHPDRDVDIVRTYPDGGHGSLALAAVPPGGSALVDFPIEQGRWLEPGDEAGVVLGHNAARGTAVGSPITLSVDGRRSTWTVVGTVEEIGGSSAFVDQAAFRRATAIDGVNVLRVATTARTDLERAAIIAALEADLAGHGVAVRHAMPTPQLRTIIDDHVLLVVRAVIFMAVLLALVGLFGLATTTAINVAERTREIAVMKAIGAGDGRIFRIIMTEAMLTGAASTVVAALLALPLTTAINAYITRKGFLAPPPFTVSTAMLVAWPIVVLAGSALASFMPARRAARLSVRAGLAE